MTRAADEKFNAGKELSKKYNSRTICGERESRNPQLDLAVEEFAELCHESVIKA